MKLSTAFRRLNKLYSDPRRWMQEEYSARIRRGGPRPLQCFCLIGGLEKVQGDSGVRNMDHPGNKALLSAVKELHPYTKKSSVESWNDAKGRNIGEIRAVVKRALKNAQRAEARAA